MNKTKMIYFLSAVVLIIGCYALNLSYSLFVQTEEKEAVSSTVPKLSYSLNDTNKTSETYELLPNSNKLITLKVNNNGSSNLKYRVSTNAVENVSVKLINKYDSKIEGTLNSDKSNYIWLNVTNNNESTQEITFNLEAIYDTLNFSSEYISNIDISDTEVTLKDNIIVSSQYASLNNSKDVTHYSSLKVEELKEDNVNLLLNTPDNYGDSYYFRGNVNNNYINFNDMCWKVVRILGNGNIKLVLEDANNICNASTDNKINTFVTDSLYKDISFGNLSDTNNAFKTITDEFKEYLVSDASWCQGTNIKYNDKNELITDDYLNECKTNNTCSYKYRTNDISLICNNEEMVSSPLGTLTYDEVYLSGTSKSNYLNSTSFDLPNLSSHKNGIDYRYTYDKTKLSEKEITDSYNYRPSIIIKNILNYEGDGTKVNPYVIVNSTID